MNNPASVNIELKHLKELVAQVRLRTEKTVIGLPCTCDTPELHNTECSPLREAVSYAEFVIQCVENAAVQDAAARSLTGIQAADETAGSFSGNYMGLSREKVTVIPLIQTEDHRDWVGEAVRMSPLYFMQKLGRGHRFLKDPTMCAACADPSSGRYPSDCASEVRGMADCRAEVITEGGLDA